MSSAASHSQVPVPAVFQQRRVDVLVSVQKAAQQIGSILELSAEAASVPGGAA